ncbi:hypothetical protein ITP53_25365 [Nonomuraea sp. K274]|uniref:Uncharacterized protein n=1 Tax=Nonomuraea cypriaca TaxID=1187855 RepID=A0A931AEF8_9ACTN|nr:hypothetical protein [Nonomuraea cypriaca]MBF8189003.1 hypothetical protein [Nonomuraea cypriaca]
MAKHYLAVAVVAAATLLAAPLPVNAAPAQPLKLRGGLTLYLPIKWQVHRVSPDWIRVVTGKCAAPGGGFGTPGCDSFWVLGPKAIKEGNELFRPYTGKRPFYPATDVQRCPTNAKWGQRLGTARVTGLRQVGPGHKAAYREWKATCVSYSSGEVKSRYTQREWYLPTTRILVVDQWNTPGLADALENADWRQARASS